MSVFILSKKKCELRKICTVKLGNNDKLCYFSISRYSKGCRYSHKRLKEAFSERGVRIDIPNLVSFNKQTVM